MLRRDSGHSRVRPWFDADRPKVAIVDILQRHRHDAGPSVDLDTAEELQPEAWCEVFALLRAAPLLENCRRSERVVELARSPRPRMQRARDEFPEWLEIGKYRAVRIVIMRGRVMHVGRQPHGIADPGAFDERQ